MFISQYVCLIAFTLLYLGSYLNTDCYGLHVLDYKNSNYSSRIKRQESCGFRCTNGQCISEQSQCDGISDCTDKSDEDLKCLELSKSCPTNAFRCAYGACVDGDAGCNGVQNCADNSDETDCTNATRNNCGIKFACKSGQCIDRHLQCDGAKDCTDGSDEILASCNHIQCQDFSYTCAYGACIDEDLKCNGISDCADGSDESSQICGGTPPVTLPTLPEGSCALPPQPANGKYTTDQSFTQLTYSCLPGNQLYPSPNNNIAVCVLGKWYPGLPECLRTCGPRISDSVETYCEHKGIEVDCSKTMVEGTTVRMKCKQLYSQVDSSANPVSVCSDGSWDYSFIKCVPECGNIVPEGDVYIVGGKQATKNTFPWHVGIYKLNKLNQYEQNCGGSIITRKVILSAAHCFTNYADGTLYDTKQYAVAAGKYYRSYYETTDIFSQNSTVKTIIIPPEYKGFLSSFAADIAFVILDKALELTQVVQPVCIDWNNQYERIQLRYHNLGIVVGWGNTKEGADSSIELKQLSVPYVPLEHCVRVVPESFIRFLTRDKFCAGFTNGSSVCHGDSGGGLVFKREDNKRYYLRGLVSVGPVKEGACDSRQYGAYTKVSEYMETLRRVEISTRD